MKRITAKFIMGIFAALIIYILHAILTTPSISNIKNCPETYLHKIKLCTENPNYINLNEAADSILQAIIVSEDIHFYQHHGFDYREILNSAEKDLWQMHFARGASTISQQVVKNIFFSDKKSIHRKIQEAWLTILLEKNLSKVQILEKYINLIELGPNVFGLKQAADIYFHKKPKDLTFLESAYLAHLLPNPKVYSKSIGTQKLTPFNRIHVLLICKKLWQYGYISAAQYLAAQRQLDDFPWFKSSASQDK